MSVFDSIVAFFNQEPANKLDDKLKSDLNSFIESQYGKPYVTVEKQREQAQKLRAEQIEKARKARLEEEAKKKKESPQEDKKEAEPSKDIRYSRDVPTDIRYSIPTFEDREELSRQADSYFQYAYNGRFDYFQPQAGFKELLLSYIISSGMDNVEIYKRANISKSVFSSIMTNTVSVPKKSTVIALAIALKLNLEETERLLMKAGYTFSNSIKGDLVAVYFINHKIYDIHKLNIALHDIGEPLLGSKM